MRRQQWRVWTPTLIRAGSPPGLSERPPRDREMWGEAEEEEGITPSGETEGVWGQEEAGTELDQRPVRTCKYPELTSNTSQAPRH